MKEAQPKIIKLEDYRQPDFWISETILKFELFEDHALVHSEIQFTRRDTVSPSIPLVLHGEELELISLCIDKQPVEPQNYQVTEESLTVNTEKQTFVLECTTKIKPQDNTRLEGLYKSSGMFCTQCEAEGFRRITFYLDRPDVMSKFTTTIVADKTLYPVLLANGNPIAQGDMEDGRHWVVWEDPFKKPSYLFALVAGDLVCVKDEFITMSHRTIDLRLYVESQNQDKCEHALISLKKSMLWDEQVYGREYDLDIFMIVAVDAFNMGAMENKGLNIFNSSCVLAKPETSTDMAYERIEAIVAHEYFHNWSGNRVTCRDWFQLSLKEGFTVFRDSQFTADMTSEVVKRIDDVNFLRTRQFAEDAGPMAHPIRPSSFIEISNFYTVTVYEKGAEVVRMIHTLLGPEKFRKGSDLYFERHDGQAVTTEDFVTAMEDASGVDLTQFKNWYSQAGTPEVKVTSHYDSNKQSYEMVFEQQCPKTSNDDGDKKEFHIPIAFSLFDPQGQEMPLSVVEDQSNIEFNSSTKVLSLKCKQNRIVFDGVADKPVPSLLRHFSAPVKLEYPYTEDELLFLMQHDTDGFNRWDASQTFAVKELKALMTDFNNKQPLTLNEKFIQGLGTVLVDKSGDSSMIAKLLSLPSVGYLCELQTEIDIDATVAARNGAKLSVAEALESQFLEAYNKLNTKKPYAYEKTEVGRRCLKNLCLTYLMSLEKKDYLDMALEQYHQADNMTDVMSALRDIVHSPFDEKVNVLTSFYETWKHDNLVVNQWLSVQASNPEEGAMKQILSLLHHEAFDIKNPNKVRSLIGVFCDQNVKHFHAKSGEGYKFLSDHVIRLDALNPQIASRLLTPLTGWKKFDVQRQGLMKAELERISQQDKLSKDVYEVVSKTLN